MYLEFTVGRACVADPNLGRTRAGSGATTGRFEQQPDAIAAGFEVVTVAAQSRLCIEAPRPRARSLFGTEEGRGADLGAGRYRQGRVIAGRQRRGFAAIERKANVAERRSIALGLIRQRHAVAIGIG